ncbi:zinc finger translocation-associated protein-like isoform X1 [Mobula birostris]|uniref:zinc finger translocation-associated protein-like isoform X1 n=1 Tax=Mobula birostris TaxID=1983395 RepID=UPI003B28CD9A
MEPGQVEVALQPDTGLEPRAVKEERPDPGGLLFASGVVSGSDRVTPAPGPSVSGEARGPKERRGRAPRYPCRSHRRNYQERWRLEYLMDYDRWRHGLVCMVCGATLATLKLSTIKRHILQRHQASLLLTQSEKEAVIAGWEEHLLGQSYLQEGLPVPGLGPSQHPGPPRLAPVDATSPPMDVIPPPPPVRDPSLPPYKAPARRGRPPGKKPKTKAKAKPPPPVSRRQGPGCPSAKRVKRYYQERWRSEYLMEYDGLRHGLVCMVCGSALATLKLSTIKRHILQKHQASLSLTPRQKDVVMATWAEHPLNQSRRDIKRQGAGLDGLHQPYGQSQVDEQEAVPPGGYQTQAGRTGMLDQSQMEMPEAAPGLAGVPPMANRFQQEEAGQIQQLQIGEPICLINQLDIGFQESAEAAVHFNRPHFNQSEFEMPKLEVEPSARFLQSHGRFHRSESAQILSQSQILVEPRRAEPAPPPAGSPLHSGPTEPGPLVKAEAPPALRPPPSPDFTAGRGGRGARRSFQRRWRTEHLMDYDPQRRRLLCMVCGQSLAVLSLRTIRRHVLRSHPHSLHLNRAEKENILEAWGEQGRPQEPEPEPQPLQREAPAPAPAAPTRCYQERWRTEHLMDYDPVRRRLLCMVCGKSLAALTLGSIRRHVLRSHPHSLHFSPTAREDILQAWSKQRMESVAPAPEPEPVRPLPPSPQHPVAAAEPTDQDLGDLGERLEVGVPTPVEIEVYVDEPESRPANPRRTPGRDHRRNYQERWRLEYLMDYDRWRHGLVCMVCGATLATLKLSTIKRHILQRHQASLGYSLTQKVLLAQEWDRKMTVMARVDVWHLPGVQNRESPPGEPGALGTGGD